MEGSNVMPASIDCAKAGVTTDMGAVFREVFGEYRAPTGVPKAARQVGGDLLEPVRAEVERVSHKLGRRMEFLVGKPGLDGHSKDAKQVVQRARDVGMDVIYPVPHRRNWSGNSQRMKAST